MSFIVRTMFDGYSRDGKRLYHKGGGGGGNSGVYYANQDKLLGVQADIAQNMYNQYASYGPQRLEAMSKMADEAMDGTLADRARSTAAADAGTALSTSLAAAGRNMERYGTTLNPNALQANTTDVALAGAAQKTGAMNRAQQWAEGQKWARTSDLYGALQGMPGNATAALGQAASGYGQMAGQQNQVAMANAMGYGQMGGMLGYGLMARDGGYIHEGEVIRRGDDGAPGYAAGGMPKLADWRSYPTTVQTGSDTPSAAGQVLSGMAPAAGMFAAKKVLGPYVKQGMSYIGDQIKQGFNGLTGTGELSTADHATRVAEMQSQADAELAALRGTSGAESAVTTPLAEQPAIMGTDLTAEGANLAGTVGTDALETGGAMALEGAGEAAAADAAITAGTDAALAGTMATEAAMGPVGWAALAGTALYSLGDNMDWWADGGPVPHEMPPQGGLRRDMRPGGKVQGPGTATSDSIPAWLSNGEYVVNAEGVKEIGKDKLEKANAKGLKKRAAKAKPKAAPRKKAISKGSK